MSGEPPAAEGANLLVDAHQHFQNVERHYYPWLFAPGRAILGAVSALAAGLSEAERRAVLSGTAERVYRI